MSGGWWLQLAFSHSLKSLIDYKQNYISLEFLFRSHGPYVLPVISPTSGQIHVGSKVTQVGWILKSSVRMTSITGNQSDKVSGLTSHTTEIVPRKYQHMTSPNDKVPLYVTILRPGFEFLTFRWFQNHGQDKVLIKIVKNDLSSIKVHRYVNRYHMA